MSKITVPEVAKVLGKTPQIVRDCIKSGLYPFAVAFKPPGRVKWNFTIFPAKFEEYCGTGGKMDTPKPKETTVDFTKSLINPPKQITVRDVAKRLGKDPQIVREYIEAGLYPFAEAHKLYGRIQITIFPKEFEEYCVSGKKLDTKSVRKITVKDVANHLRKDPNIVREYIEAGLYPFAVAYKRKGSTKSICTIFPAKFEEYCGSLDAEIKKVTPADVAKRFGIKDHQNVRECIKWGIYPFAAAYKRPGKNVWSYTIFPAKFEEYCATGGRPDLSKLEITEE